MYVCVHVVHMCACGAYMIHKTPYMHDSQNPNTLPTTHHSGHLSERDASVVAATLFKVIKACHDAQILHRGTSEEIYYYHCCV